MYHKVKVNFATDNTPPHTTLHNIFNKQRSFHPIISIVDTRMKVYLESCTISQKGAVKKAGAQWDGYEKKWYVPMSLLHQIEHFNHWKPMGRMYLNCPFNDKERAKKLGAKWDVECKKWFFVPTKGRKEEDFREWLLPSSFSSSDAAASSNMNFCNGEEENAASSKKSKKSKEKKVGVAKKKESTPISEKGAKAKGRTNKQVTSSTPVASLLPRINNDMTINELQEECRARDPSIKGISNKNKQWFFDRLDIGSVCSFESETKFQHFACWKE